MPLISEANPFDDSDDGPHRDLIRVPDPPPYVPIPPDPLEAAQVAQLEARGDRNPGEIIPEPQP